MAYIGKTPTPAPLTSSDIAADIINNTHIGDTAISGFDALATAPADTDEFLISDAGTLKRIDASLIGGGGKLLQIQNMSATGETSTSSQTFQDTHLTDTITCSATSSKVLIFASFSHRMSNSNGNSVITIEQAISGGATSTSGEQLINVLLYVCDLLLAIGSVSILSISVFCVAR